MLVKCKNVNVSKIVEETITERVVTKFCGLTKTDPMFSPEFVCYTPCTKIEFSSR